MSAADLRAEALRRHASAILWARVISKVPSPQYKGKQIALQLARAALARAVYINAERMAAR